jgi:hypothetical protein
VVYGTCGAILVACLAAANMPSQDPAEPMTHASRVARINPDSIAADVQSQAARLHERMAEAPAPAAAVRNPFAFGEPRAPRSAPRADVVHATVVEEAAAAVAPALLLMGIAEETTANGPRRTAIIGGEGDALFMVVEGESVGRYKITKIGADAVELEDQTTKGYRRLALR